MGFYLNGTGAYSLFQADYSLTYFVDKSGILKELVPILELKNPAEKGGSKGSDPRYVCITRPRRFGKTVIANMIASYFGKGIDSSAEFDTLQAASYDWYKKHLNTHNVIRISFNELPEEPVTYASYMARIKKRLLKDLRMAFPEAEIEKEDALWDALTAVYEYCGGERFIFVLDEWDYIYHQDFVTDAEREAFTKFLSNLLKDKPYVEMAYMTGVSPVAKYTNGLDLNMFSDYTMESHARYSEYFGFTDEEVDDLYQRYRREQKEPKLTREDLACRYDGYQTFSGIRLYNPYSVIEALSDNRSDSYRVSTEPQDKNVIRSDEKWAELNREFGSDHLEKYSMRMDYMCGEELCTVILINFRDREIVIRNHTMDVIHRAFGVIEYPDWEEFEEFLENRCFPRTRFHLDLVLSDLGLDFYDPLSIIEKTQGRMAEDFQWIRIWYFRPDRHGDTLIE
ncbi:MAG: AAA family ATPase [Lachnospiraceae bacterium]|nr:AAA family ATPase [Lachnospiraceae bacterium]